MATQIDTDLAVLMRGVSSVAPEGGLRAKLETASRERRPLRVKLGLDPTAPDIHLGFAVVLRKLRQFQDLGHEVIIIIGDATALIGDPSGRSATRPMLTADEIRANGATYVNQLACILDRSRTTVRFNSEWLGGLDFTRIVELTSRMTVAQVLAREDFADRLAGQKPIGLHELLYPLAQAYDSVSIEADVEMGGHDQVFNILAGRELQKELGQPEQIGMFMPLLVGLDGVKKMSKSLGNYIGIAESPDTMFAKTMSMPDTLMRDYFVLCTDVPVAEYESLLDEAGAGRLNPKDVKRRLGREIVTMYHSATAADAADAEWQRVHAEGELPTEMPVKAVPADAFRDGRVWICRLIVAAGLAGGTREARRLLEQGAVSINDERITDADAELEPAAIHAAVLRVGPRRYVRLEAPG